NLTNINITERAREIATLKVLGFYRHETRSYVLRENLVLSLMGIAVGLPFGVLLHRFVMDQINIDIVSFAVTILPQSHLYSVLTALAFTLAVNLLMDGRIERISMTESLKAMEGGRTNEAKTGGPAMSGSARFDCSASGRIRSVSDRIRSEETVLQQLVGFI